MVEPGTPCKQCGTSDRYYRGTFSYCRFCHNEAVKRHKSFTSMKDKKPLPKRDLQYLMSPNGRRGASERAKLACPQGHPYSGDNLRIDTSRGKICRKCRACERNRKRVSYGLEPDSNFSKLSDMLDTDGSAM